MTKQEIIKQLKTAGVDFPKTAKKEDLQYLLNTLAEVKEELRKVSKEEVAKAIDENPEAEELEIKVIAHEGGQKKAEAIITAGKSNKDP